MRMNKYYYSSPKRNQGKKIVALIICGSVVFGTTYSIASIIHKKEIYNKPAQTQQLGNKKIEDYSIKGQELKSEISKVNKMVALEGTKSFTFTFKNKDIYVDSKNSFVKFLKTKLSEMTLRECNYNTEYKFMVTYDNSKIQITNDSDKLYISIDESDLQVCGLQENKDKVIIDSDIGILTNDFDKNETVAMGRAVQGEIYNYLVNSGDIMQQSIDNVRSNISDMCKKLGVKNYQIEIHKTNVMEYGNSSLSVN